MKQKIGTKKDKLEQNGGAPQALIDHAKARTDEVINRLQKAMDAIEVEIEQNDGLYPYNRGSINQAEVCRRAGIKNVTLQGKAHKTSTKEWVDKWVSRVRVGIVKGSRNVRRKVTDRAESWKEAHRQIADAYHIDQLKAQKRIKELEEENQLLREQLAQSSGRKVVPLRWKKPD